MCVCVWLSHREDSFPAMMLSRNMIRLDLAWIFFDLRLGQGSLDIHVEHDESATTCKVAWFDSLVILTPPFFLLETRIPIVEPKNIQIWIMVFQRGLPGECWFLG